jgi:hypothetical protein
MEIHPLAAALLQLIPNKGLRRIFRQVGQSKRTEKEGSVSCNRSLMVVVVSRRNSKAVEDVVEAGRCTCNDADPHIVCGLRFSAIATAMRLRVILGVSLVPSRLPPARPYKKDFFFFNISGEKKDSWQSN